MVKRTSSPWNSKVSLNYSFSSNFFLSKHPLELALSFSFLLPKVKHENVLDLHHPNMDLWYFLNQISLLPNAASLRVVSFSFQEVLKLHSILNLYLHLCVQRNETNSKLRLEKEGNFTFNKSSHLATNKL